MRGRVAWVKSVLLVCGGEGIENFHVKGREIFYVAGDNNQMMNTGSGCDQAIFPLGLGAAFQHLRPFPKDRLVRGQNVHSGSQIRSIHAPISWAFCGFAAG
jgi:hypothetical protein